MHWKFVEYQQNVCHDDVIKWKHFPRYWLCAGNSLVTGEFPSQRPVTWSFDVFSDLRLNKRLSKQSWGWWFETPSCSLWRHCNENVFTGIYATFVVRMNSTNFFTYHQLSASSMALCGGGGGGGGGGGVEGGGGGGGSTGDRWFPLTKGK